jgi:hypothetical protein
MKKSGKHASHVLNSNNANRSFPTVPTSLVLVALFEKIYDGEPILTVFSLFGKDVSVKSFM